MRKKCSSKKGRKNLYEVGGQLQSRGLNSNNFDINSLMLNQANVTPELAAMNTNAPSAASTGGMGMSPMAMAGAGLKGVAASADSIAFNGKSDQEIADFYATNYNQGKQYDLTKENMNLVGSAVSGDIGGAMQSVGNMFNTYQDRKTDIEDISGFSEGDKGKLKAYNAIDTIAPTLGGLGLGIQALTNLSGTKKRFDAQMKDIHQKKAYGAATGARDSSLGISNQMNFKENGGSLDTALEKLNPSLKLIEINEGESHLLNPNGGVPQGISGDNGNVNMVEEGETRFGDYVLSNKLKLGEKDLDGLGKSLKGKTFADASKKLYKEVDERPNDPIAKRTWVNNVSKLIQGNELAKSNTEK